MPSQPLIELDVQTEGAGPSHRRSRPNLPEPEPSLPPLENILGEGWVGSDQTEQTVGFLFLLSALPGVILGLMGHGGALLSAIVPILIGLGFLNRSDLIRKWVLISCIFQLALGTITLFAAPKAIFVVLGLWATQGGLLMLVSGKALSRNAYLCSIGGVVLGTVIGTLSSFF